MPRSVGRRPETVNCGPGVESAKTIEPVQAVGTTKACTPDVWRLCGAHIPDVDRIVACLRRNTPQLNDLCRAVLNKATMRPHVVRIATGAF